MILLLSMLLAAAPETVDLPLTQGGICTGIAWVPVPAGAKVTKSEGPDFDVIYVDGTAGQDFGVYIGGYPMASADPGKPLLEVAGLAIRPSHARTKFQGYIVAKGDYLKNHFFGAAFADNETDQAFFNRAAFGDAAAAKCAKPTGTGK